LKVAAQSTGTAIVSWSLKEPKRREVIVIIGTPQREADQTSNEPRQRLLAA
jgi:hypothetical protein